MTPVPRAAHQGISALRRRAADQRERGLQRVHVPDGLAALEQRHVEVGDAGRAHLPLLHQPLHLGPGVLHRRAGLVGPVELVEVDPLDAEPAKRRLALPADGLGSKHLARATPCDRPRPRPWPHLVNTNGRSPAGTPVQRAADDLLGVTEAVHRGGVDPVDAARDRVADGATDCSSSCGPQPKAQSPPPIAQAPNPTVVISMSVVPRRRVGPV